MEKTVHGHSHEFIVKEDGHVIAHICADYRPYKSGLAVSVQYGEGVGLAELAFAFLAMSETLERAADGSLEREWELSVAEAEVETAEELPF